MSNSTLYDDIFTSDAWVRHGSDEDDMAAQLSSYVGDPPAATSLPPGSEFTPFRPDEAELHAGHFLGLLWAIAQPVQGWYPYRDTATTTTASGTTALLTWPPVRPGWELKINRVTISIGGASAAATAALYVGPEFGETAAPSEAYLVDFAGSMLGASPSRVTATPVNPYYLGEGDQLLVSLAGIAAAPQACFVRIEGVRRQKQ